MSESSDETTLNIYKRFIKTGAIRTVLSRVTSVIYIIIISRLVLPDLYDFVAVLAGFHVSIIAISTLGFKYSVVHFTNKEQYNNEQLLALPVKASIFISGPLMILIWEILLRTSIYLGYAGRLEIFSDNLLLSVLYDLSIYVIVVLEGLKTSLDAEIKSDEVAKIDTINSVGQSFMIIVFWLLIEQLYSFFLAWTVVALVPLFLWRKRLTVSLRQKLNINLSWKVFKLGTPIFLMYILSQLGKQMARFVVFFDYPEGSTTLYYWITRFNELTLYTMLVITSGLFPLLLKHNQTREEMKMLADNKSYFRIASFIAQIAFGSLAIASPIILTIVLPDYFGAGTILFFIIGAGTLLQAQVSLLEPQLQAFASRRWVVIINLSVSLSSILLPFYLSQFSLEAVGSTVLIVSLIRFSLLLFISKTLKFDRRMTILVPILVSVGVFTIAIFLNFIAVEIWMNLIFLCFFPFLIYYIHRILGLITERELHIFYRFLPDKLVPVFKKFLK